MRGENGYTYRYTRCLQTQVDIIREETLHPKIDKLPNSIEQEEMLKIYKRKESHTECQTQNRIFLKW